MESAPPSLLPLEANALLEDIMATAANEPYALPSPVPVTSDHPCGDSVERAASKPCLDVLDSAISKPDAPCQQVKKDLMCDLIDFRPSFDPMEAGVLDSLRGEPPAGDDVFGTVTEEPRCEDNDQTRSIETPSLSNPSCWSGSTMSTDLDRTDASTTSMSNPAAAMCVRIRSGKPMAKRKATLPSHRVLAAFEKELEETTRSLLGTPAANADQCKSEHTQPLAAEKDQRRPAHQRKPVADTDQHKSEHQRMPIAMSAEKDKCRPPHQRRPVTDTDQHKSEHQQMPLALSSEKECRPPQQRSRWEQHQRSRENEQCRPTPQTRVWEDQSLLVTTRNAGGHQSEPQHMPIALSAEKDQCRPTQQRSRWEQHQRSRENEQCRPTPQTSAWEDQTLLETTRNVGESSFETLSGALIGTWRLGVDLSSSVTDTLTLGTWSGAGEARR